MVGEKAIHRPKEARLPSVDFQVCVEFIIDKPEGEEPHANIFDDAHGTSKTQWKLRIVNETWATFVHHSCIGDRLTGCAFHRTFLAALDEKQTASQSKLTAAFTLIPDSTKNPPPYTSDQIDETLSWLQTISNLVLWHIIRLFSNKKPKHFLFSDATFPKTHPTVIKPPPVEERTVTKVQAALPDAGIVFNCYSVLRPCP